ncbi:hypothetical protein Dsin_025198 [Dipteronia sinensis]|uniref:Oligopeptide transporter n=1 Tax=Dipteronia sinensis TaxID=43782 RepID=A0AAD9ZWW0_9ROSI|nr:hypothetical protein Dsin_025198 [Dipteronia sinensis]
MNRDGDEITDESPIEQVRLTVPITDDPTLPTLTFRTWVLGPLICAILAFAFQFSIYRQNLFTIPNICVQILIAILGKSMAGTLPSKLVKVPGTSWSFSMNPGPFNIKEHVLLSILATTGSDGAFNIATLAVRKLYYHKYVNFWPGLLMIMTTQLLGYGFAGIFMKFLVYNPYMWYPFILLDVSFYRALHEVEVRPKRGITKLQFFVVVSVASFAYAMIPGYFFPSIGALSVVCLLWKNSVIAQLIGSGRNGFGIASFSFDWNVISGFLSNPLAFPFSTIVNTAIGFILMVYIICPIADVWQQFKRAYGNSNNSTFEDVHNRLMKKYNPIPQWWFYAIMVSTIGLLIYSCEGFGKQFQLPYWGILLSCLLVMIFILPLGVLSATTGQDITLSVASELLIGYIYPGKPIANMVFRDLCLSTNYHALSFISDFKLAHYMKIPPKSMFVAQTTGTIISTLASFATSWWLISTVENICEQEKLPKGSPWTCPQMTAAYDFSVIWGVIGPKRMFFPDGMYSKLYYFFLIGAITPLLIWVLSKLFPEKGWIKSINIPIIMAGASALLAAGTVSYWSWIFVGIVFNWIVYRKYKDWWGRYNYLLAYGLDLGVAFQVLSTSMTLQMSGVYGVNWWGLDVEDHCPLSQCPTAPGVSTEGFPVL